MKTEDKLLTQSILEHRICELDDMMFELQHNRMLFLIESVFNDDAIRALTEYRDLLQRELDFLEENE